MSRNTVRRGSTRNASCPSLSALHHRRNIARCPHQRYTPDARVEGLGQAGVSCGDEDLDAKRDEHGLKYGRITTLA